MALGSEPVQSVAILASDGATLRAWYIRPPDANSASVILLHGMADTREGMLGYAPMFLRQGYSVLLPDSRAHGSSGGPIATYGVIERDDVRLWVRWLRGRNPGCDYLFGESMGAAIAIQAGQVTPGVCAIAAEAPFATFREIANDRIAQATRLGLWFPRTLAAPAREFALFYSRARFHVDLAEANPLRAIRESDVPVLLICGTADLNIPMRHSLELYRAAPFHASLWVVQGAQHTGASTQDPARFEQRVTGWFRTYTGPVRGGHS